MTTFKHKILNALVWPLTKTPLCVLYYFGFATYAILYYVVRYRRKVVRKNLTESFPGKSKAEIKAIAKDFYLNFADYIVETIRLGGMSRNELSGRMTFENIGLVERYLNEGRPIVAYFSHCINWEWVTVIGDEVTNPKWELSEVYRPLKNKWMDAYMLRIRQRFNTRCYPKATVFRELLRRRHEGITTFTGFMSDQKPSHGDVGYTTTFLNHPTSMITGTAVVAKKLDAAVIYFDMTKLHRGRYHVRFVPMFDSAASHSVDEITEAYARLLEANINRQPSIWLWTHKRWKHPVSPK